MTAPSSASTVPISRYIHGPDVCFALMSPPHLPRALDDSAAGVGEFVWRAGYKSRIPHPVKHASHRAASATARLGPSKWAVLAYALGPAPPGPRDAPAH